MHSSDTEMDKTDFFHYNNSIIGHAMAFAGSGTAQCGKRTPRCCGLPVMRRPGHAVALAGFGAVLC